MNSKGAPETANSGALPRDSGRPPGDREIPRPAPAQADAGRALREAV